MGMTQQIKQTEEKEITHKKGALNDKAHLLKEMVAQLRNRLCPILKKLPENALRGTPISFAGTVRPTAEALHREMTDLSYKIGGTSPLYEQLSGTAETLDCTISEIEEIIENLEI